MYRQAGALYPNPNPNPNPNPKPCPNLAPEGGALPHHAQRRVAHEACARGREHTAQTAADAAVHGTMLAPEPEPEPEPDTSTGSGRPLPPRPGYSVPYGHT